MPLDIQRRQKTGGDHSSPIPTHGPAQQCPQEYGLVVLGVMYPSVVPQPSQGIPGDLPHLLPDVATGWQCTDVIFYDPISSVGSGDPIRTGSLGAISEVPLSPKHEKKGKGSRHESRMNAMEAVARELAMLSLRNRR